MRSDAGRGRPQVSAPCGVRTQRRLARVLALQRQYRCCGVRTRQVVGGVLISEDRVLLCHRSPNRAWFPDVWDLPGGHVEFGESTAEALARELREELGISVDAPSSPPAGRINGPEFELLLWVVASWSGQVENRDVAEHDSVAWFAADELQNLDFAAPSYRRALIAALAQSR